MKRKINSTKQITIKEVAQAAGVSIATVSRVLNKQAVVSKELSDKVEIAVKELNYQLNGIAKALKSSQSRSIGLIIPDIENPFFPALVRGVEDAAQKEGYAVILCNTDGKPEEEDRYLKFLLSKQVDGILLVGNLKFAQYENYLSSLSIPLVLLDRRMEDAPYSTVLVDNELGAFMAVDHLIKQGRRHIAILRGKPESPTSMERVKGAMKGLTDHGYSLEENLILTGYFTFEGGYQGIERLIDSGQSFDAVFAANDMMAIGAMECLEKHGRCVPDDVAVVGFDDIRMAAWHKPSLTTIKQPVYEMGQVAVKIIVEHITGSNTNCTDQILKPELIVRQSSGEKGDVS